MGRLRLNPFMLSVAIVDLDIREKDGASSFLGWGRLYVRFDALRSIAGAWVLGDVELDQFHAAVAINPDGSFNFSDLLAKFAAPADAHAKPGRPVCVGRMKVEDARVDFNDRSLIHPFATTAGPLTFALTEFQTSGARGAPFHFEASTEAGERFTLRGTLAADPVASRGDFEAAGLVIKKYSPYFEKRVSADVTGGRLTVRGHYEMNFDPKGRVIALEHGELHLSGLSVAERANSKPVIELGSLEVLDARADAVGMRGSVGRIAMADGHLHVRRDKAGVVNLLHLVPSDGSTPATARSSAPKFTLSELAIERFAVDIDDEAIVNHARLSLGDLKLAVKNFSLEEGARIPLELSFGWAPKGTVHVDGSFVLKPQVTADMTASVAGLSILPLSPYLEQFVNARISEGIVSATGAVHVSLAGSQPDIELKGDFAAEKFGLVDKAHDSALLGFSRLTLTGISAKTSPALGMSVAQVDLVGPYVRVVVNKEGSPNLASLVAQPPGKPRPGQTGKTPPAENPKVEIGRVTVDGGNFSFTDQSVEPNVHVVLGAFAGTLSGLSSENMARADVNLYGMVDGVGPLDITGKLDPLGAQMFVDLKVDAKGVDLLPLSPYTGKYAGYELARGQLVVDSRILVDGAKIDSTNRVTLNQFNFGSATASKDATKLPVRLAVALLKDVNGQIYIDLPVQGRLDDPEFRIGKVVWHVIGNLLTRAAVSPFSLVGSMFGGGGEELAFQEFAPGSSELEKDDLQKLDTLAKVLANRPALTLAIAGGYDAAADAYALKHVRLDRLVRRQVWEARHVTDPNILPPDQLVITQEESAAMVKKLFDAKFPPGTRFGTPLPAAPQIAPPPPGPPPGFLKRLVDAFTLKKERDATASRKESERLSAEHEKAVTLAVANGLPLTEMTGRLAEAIEVTPDDLLALSASRAQRVREQLVNAGHIGADRLFLSKDSGPGGQSQGPRVRLSFQ